MNRDDLTDTARIIYDEEIVHRGLKKELPAIEEIEKNSAIYGDIEALIENESPAPSWLQDSVLACAFTATPGSHAAEEASQAQTALKGAGIPSFLRVTRELEDGDDLSDYDILKILVPAPLFLHATSILDRDVFSLDYETEWRAHLSNLSDRDLTALDPEIFCAGFLAFLARIKKAYAEEMTKRRLIPK